MRHLLPLCALLAPISVAFAQQSSPVNLQPGAVITLPAGALPTALAIADFNQDYRNDVAVCQRGLGTVGVYLQTRGGAFPNPAVGTYAVGQGPTGVVAVALGPNMTRASADLVAISPISSYYTLLTNNTNGSGTFTPVVNVGSINSFGSGFLRNNPQLIVANLDGDQLADFVYNYDPPAATIDAGVYWKELASSISMEFGYRSYHRPGYRPSSMALADFDRDGVTDVVSRQP